MSNIPSERSLPAEFSGNLILAVKSWFDKIPDMASEAFSPKKRNQFLRRMLSLFLFFGIWQLLCVVKFRFWINFSFLPSPTEVFSATVNFFTTNAMIHIQSSLTRVLVGYLVATVLGVSRPSEAVWCSRENRDGVIGKGIVGGSFSSAELARLTGSTWCIGETESESVGVRSCGMEALVRLG